MFRGRAFTERRVTAHNLSTARYQTQIRSTNRASPLPLGKTVPHRPRPRVADPGSSYFFLEFLSAGSTISLILNSGLCSAPLRRSARWRSLNMMVVIFVSIARRFASSKTLTKNDSAPSCRQAPLRAGSAAPT